MVLTGLNFGSWLSSHEKPNQTSPATDIVQNHIMSELLCLIRHPKKRRTAIKRAKIRALYGCRREPLTLYDLNSSGRRPSSPPHSFAARRSPLSAAAQCFPLAPPPPPPAAFLSAPPMLLVRLTSSGSMRLLQPLLSSP
ncbi:Os07g0553450, partial [Oryza sativa Japonica Group]